MLSINETRKFLNSWFGFELIQTLVVLYQFHRGLKPADQFWYGHRHILIHCYTSANWFSDLLFERFTVNSFNLVKMILRCENYKPSKNLHGKFYLKKEKTQCHFQVDMHIFASIFKPFWFSSAIHCFMSLQRSTQYIWLFFSS